MRRIDNYKKTKDELASAYKEIANDPEVLELAEMGISDFEEMINESSLY